MTRFYLSKLPILTAILAGICFSSLAQPVTFNTPSSSPVTYSVPNGVTSIGVDMAGGSGGTSLSSIGGLGGRIQCTIAVSTGQILNIYVGGAGANHNNSGVSLGGANGGGTGYYYGGGGGGASDIRIGGTATTNRVAVAGGGGGGGYDCGSTNGENGGSAGGTTASNGNYCNTSSTCVCGAGASGATPGAAATCYSGLGSGTAAGVGGSDGGSTLYGGGGGGGYAGGGAGAYGGGGGGSSFPASGATSGVVSGVTNTGNYWTGNGYVIICAPNLGAIIGNSPVCVGLTNALSSTGSGGTWSSNNTSIATVSSTGVVTGVATGTAVITYAASVAGCGSGYLTATVTVNPTPTPILGTSSACVGSSSTLADAGGGTWSSSDATKASVVASTGVVSGVSAGTPFITYTLPVTGCYTVTPFTVNPLPNYITGSNTVCASGATTVLADITPGGSWSSANPAVATITSGSGIVTGGTAGNTTITYALPTTCAASFTITVNPLPAVPAGSASVCTGSATTLTDAGGGTWSSSNVSVAAVGPTGIVTGVTPGTANIIFTNGSGCANSASMLVNPLPAVITGTLSFCNGNSTTLSSTTLGGSWSSSNLSIATVIPTTGLVNSVSSGIPVITYTLPTTCYTTAQVTINALPSAFAVTGGGAYCAGTGGVHIGLGLSSTGVNYQLYNGPTLITTVGGSNSALDFGVYLTAGTYTVIGINASTACSNNMSGSTTITINPLPNTYNVTGGGSFCPGGTGVHVTQSGSDASINYQLRVGGVPVGTAVAGTGMPLDFGPQTTPGNYTVTAISPTTGCSVNMVGSAVVALSAVPPIHTINAGGSYCSGGTGVAISLDGSDASVNYQLYYGTSPLGIPMTGTGSPLGFGMQTGAGSYTIVATNTGTGCTSNMSGTANISINPLPLVFFVTGGGGFCPGGAGAHVNLNYSTTGVNYQLYLASSPVAGGLIAGSNAGLDFGLQTTAGTYSVVAIDASTMCTKNMSGSANVFINPLPASHTVTGGGAYCAGGTGVHIGLNGSNTGITYQLWSGGAALGSPVAGTGTPLDFGIHSATGSYTVSAINSTTSCSSNMTGVVSVSVNPLPNVDSVYGSGSGYCAGGTGIDILLSGSDAGVSYQMYRGGSSTGSPVAGTGSLLDLGLHTLTGLYTVIATNTITGCMSNMVGGANVVINPAPAVYVITGGGAYCSGGSGVHVGLSSSTLGVNYQVFNPGGPGAVVAGTGSSIDFGLQTVAGTYSVTATDVVSGTGCTSNMVGSPTVNVNPLPVTYPVTGSGNYCAGMAGLPVYLSSSTAAFHYQLYSSTGMSGIYMTGSGGAINFGNHTAGTYFAVATNPSTGCSDTMLSTAVIVANSLPATQVVTGGGPYCAGGMGSDVSLGGSVPGINYQLMYAGTALGSPMGGTGASLDFGSQTGAGTYTVIATDTTTYCTSNMTGGAVISIVPQPVAETVTGGGAYCAGGTGESIGLSSSNAGISYQLMNGPSAVGSLITGTGSALSLGTLTAAGTYTVIASPGGLCQTNMTGSATITISPLPTLHTVTGGGNYCANDSGSIVNLNGSNSGISYQLYRGTAMVGSAVTGSGSSISFGHQTISGLYTVVATNTVTGCTSTMTGSAGVSVIPVPPVYNVSGGGPYCTGGNGSDVLLSNSTTDVNYQLFLGGVPQGTPMPGTGTVLDFGLQLTAGNYTIVGTDAATLCFSNMADTASVSISPLVVPVVSLSATPGLSIKMGQADTLIATVTNGGTGGPMYQWKINGFPISGATNSMFISNLFTNNDTVSCDVTSTGMCGDNTSTKAVILSVRNTVNVNQVVAGTSDVKVIPNPNKGIFTLSGTLGSSDDVDVTIEVLDVVGHVVYTQKAVAHNGTLNERIQLNGAIANGMYLLNMRSDVASQVFHIVVEQ